MSSLVRSPINVGSICLSLLIGIPVVLLWGLWVWARWANSVPAYLLPREWLPDPNGCLRAAVLATKLAEARALPNNNMARAVWSRSAYRRLLPLLDEARPILDGVRATFRQEWKRPLAWFDKPEHDIQPVPFFVCAHFFVAESEHARRRGHREHALLRRLDALELGSRLVQYISIADGSFSLNCMQTGYFGIEEIIRGVPPSTLSASVARVRRLQALWKQYPESLDRYRQHLLAVWSVFFRQTNTSAEAVRNLRQAVSDTRGHVSLGKDQLHRWLTPKWPLLRDLDRVYRRQVAESRKPFRQRRPVPTSVELEQVGLFYGYANVGEHDWWQAQTMLALLDLALVVEQYRGVHGCYPGRIGAIPRRWLPAVPKDAWDQPLCYRLSGGRPLIYSRGPDGVDDRGIRTASMIFLTRHTQGDLVFGCVPAEKLLP